MNGIEIEVFNIDEGDGIIHYIIGLGNSLCYSCQEFYNNADCFKAFAEELSAFPKDLNHKVKFENGTCKVDGTSVDYILMLASCYRPNGASVIQVVIQRGGLVPYGHKSEFSIMAEAAAINRLGRELKSWNATKQKKFVWEVTPATVY